MGQPATTAHTGAPAPDAYPPPPWHLAGGFAGAIFPVRAAGLGGLVPAPLRPLALPGGLALGYIAVGRYGPGSTLQYNELLAGVAVRYGARIGAAIAHIAVDLRASQRGGVELWNLPKALWRFDWRAEGGRVAVGVHNGQGLVCALSGMPARARLLPLHLAPPILHHSGAAPAWLPVHFALGLAPIPLRLEVAATGPLAALRPAGPAFSFVARGHADVAALRPLGP